jgi:hypothetical protein
MDLRRMVTTWMFRLMVIAGCGIAPAGIRAQATDEVRLQAVLQGTLSGHLARSLTDRLSARPGVRLCRIDPASHNLLLHVDGSFSLSAAGLEHFFRVHGLNLRCLQQGSVNTPFMVLDPRACAEQDTHR